MGRSIRSAYSVVKPNGTDRSFLPLPITSRNLLSRSTFSAWRLMTSRRSPVSNINRKIALLRQSFGLLSLYVSMSWRQRDGARARGRTHPRRRGAVTLADACRPPSHRGRRWRSRGGRLTRGRGDDYVVRVGGVLRDC